MSRVDPSNWILVDTQILVAEKMRLQAYSECIFITEISLIKLFSSFYSKSLIYHPIVICDRRRFILSCTPLIAPLGLSDKRSLMTSGSS